MKQLFDFLGIRVKIRRRIRRIEDKSFGSLLETLPTLRDLHVCFTSSYEDDINSSPWLVISTDYGGHSDDPNWSDASRWNPNPDPKVDAKFRAMCQCPHPCIRIKAEAVAGVAGFDYNDEYTADRGKRAKQYIERNGGKKLILFGHLATDLSDYGDDEITSVPAP